MPLIMMLIERLKWSMQMSNSDRLKRKRNEAKYRLLKREIRHISESIEKVFAKFFECTASQARTNYSGLEMF